MRSKRFRTILLTGSALALAGTAVQAEAAAGTTAGTVVSNQAQASYTVNGTAQTTNSNVSSFVVDRKVAFTLVRDQTGNTQVNLGQTGAVATFRLTNTTNGAQDFILDPDQQNLSLGVLPGTDNFDVSNMRAYVDANANGVYDPGTDVRSFVDELAPDTSVTLFLVGDVPSTQSANLAFVSMHAIVAAGGTAGTSGAALVPTDLNVVNQDIEIDIVFADDDSDGAFLGDIARNGQGRAYAAFEVGAHNVDLTVAKSSRVISDGVNLINPKALPGAVVEYCLIVSNATLLTPATDVAVTDVMPANTTYQPGSIQIGALGGATACLINGIAEDDDANDGGELDPYTANFDGTARRMTANIPLLLGGASIATSFRVTIN